MRQLDQEGPPFCDPMIPAMNALEQALARAAIPPMGKPLMKGEYQDVEFKALTSEELARVRNYIERTSCNLSRCPVADFCDDELQNLLERYLAEKEREKHEANLPAHFRLS